MDGNRRWAKINNKSHKYAYGIGIKKCLDCLYWCVERDIEHLAVFGFSTDNWKRDIEDKENICEQLYTLYDKYIDTFICLDVRVKFIGQLYRFEPKCQEMMETIQEKTKDGKKCTLWIAVSYGGKDEIIEGVKQCKGEELTEDSFNKSLWSGEMPEIDILIRTSGTKRLSGFLLWKISYAEIFFIDTLWPDFSEKIFDEIVCESIERERRFGR